MLNIHSILVFWLCAHFLVLLHPEGCRNHGNSAHFTGSESAESFAKAMTSGRHHIGMDLVWSDWALPPPGCAVFLTTCLLWTSLACVPSVWAHNLGWSPQRVKLHSESRKIWKNWKGSWIWKTRKYVKGKSSPPTPRSCGASPSKGLKMEGSTGVNIMTWAVCNLCTPSSILFLLLLRHGHFLPQRRGLMLCEGRGSLLFTE